VGCLYGSLRRKSFIEVFDISAVIRGDTGVVVEELDFTLCSVPVLHSRNTSTEYQERIELKLTVLFDFLKKIILSLRSLSKWTEA
jgi:hypothetical protein